MRLFRGNLFQVEGQQMPRLCSLGSRTRNKASMAFPFLPTFPLEFTFEAWLCQGISGARKIMRSCWGHWHGPMRKVWHLLLSLPIAFCIAIINVSLDHVMLLLPCTYISFHCYTIRFIAAVETNKIHCLKGAICQAINCDFCDFLGAAYPAGVRNHSHWLLCHFASVSSPWKVSTSCSGSWIIIPATLRSLPTACWYTELLDFLVLTGV